MDWTMAIERQHKALTGILAALVAMAGATIPHHEVRGAAQPRRTLPRHLHRAILRLLRPAEAAARRLVIALARALPLPPLRFPSETSNPTIRPTILTNGVGTGIILARGSQPPPCGEVDAPGGSAAVSATGEGERRRHLSLSLLDPLRPPFAQHRPRLGGVPRISVPGFGSPFSIPVRAPLTPDDMIDAGRLHLRLRAIAAVLDNLPAAARRFARWRVRTAARQPGRHRRVWPLRPGRPPGSTRKPDHLVHEVLADTQWLALEALRAPDTS